jgi:hypothetical protein
VSCDSGAWPCHRKSGITIRKCRIVDLSVMYSEVWRQGERVDVMVVTGALANCRIAELPNWGGKSSNAEGAKVSRRAQSVGLYSSRVFVNATGGISGGIATGPSPPTDGGSG